jgi:cell division septation protein DedD
LNDNALISQPSSPEKLIPYFYKEIGTTVKTNTPRKKALPPQQYTAQLLITRSEEEAKKTVLTLSKQGISAFYTPVNRKGEVIYRVRSGIYLSEDQAKAHSEDLARNYKLKATVRAL